MRVCSQSMARARRSDTGRRGSSSSSRLGSRRRRDTRAADAAFAPVSPTDARVEAKADMPTPTDGIEEGGADAEAILTLVGVSQDRVSSSFVVSDGAFEEKLPRGVPELDDAGLAIAAALSDTPTGVCAFATGRAAGGWPTASAVAGGAPWTVVGARAAVGGRGAASTAVTASVGVRAISMFDPLRSLVSERRRGGFAAPAGLGVEAPDDDDAREKSATTTTAGGRPDRLPCRLTAGALVGPAVVALFVPALSLAAAAARAAFACLSRSARAARSGPTGGIEPKRGTDDMTKSDTHTQKDGERGGEIGPDTSPSEPGVVVGPRPSGTKLLVVISLALHDRCCVPVSM